MSHRQSRIEMTLRALDLCAGAGSLSLGFKRAGWDVLGVERDGDAWHSHCNNVGPCRLADIREFKPAQRFDAVVGGFLVKVSLWPDYVKEAFCSVS